MYSLNRKSPENLAMHYSSGTWETNMFNLDNYLYGHCHTYLPNETYLAKADGHLYAYGLNTDLNFVLPWYIFLHSKQVKIQQL